VLSWKTRSLLVYNYYLLYISIERRPCPFVSFTEVRNADRGDVCISLTKQFAAYGINAEKLVRNYSKARVGIFPSSKNANWCSKRHKMHQQYRRASNGFMDKSVLQT